MIKERSMADEGEGAMVVEEGRKLNLERDRVCVQTDANIVVNNESHHRRAFFLTTSIHPPHRELSWVAQLNSSLNIDLGNLG